MMVSSNNYYIYNYVSIVYHQQTTSAGGHGKTEFQVPKVWNRLPINLSAILALIEFGRELRLYLFG